MRNLSLYQHCGLKELQPPFLLERCLLPRKLPSPNLETGKQRSISLVFYRRVVGLIDQVDPLSISIKLERSTEGQIKLTSFYNLKIN